MEFAMSKENIQPLRGGRNPVQLEVGLQAQDNPQYHEQLMLQKQQFENAIHTYTGDDPLKNYYQFIDWVEQSFPKHGHEGNFVNLLEECLGRFENNPKYHNDIRFCKLWIKYIDMQYNHTELYQLLYSKRICIGCADMYKAWAYYYEVAGDYKRADQVYKLGKSELAQPIQELEDAHNNLIYSAGYRMIHNGAAETGRLDQQRQALISLRTVKSNQVGSVRVAASSDAVVLPITNAGFNHENRSHHAPLNVHEDYHDILFGGGVGPESILTAVKRDGSKENVMEPGSWTGALKKTRIVHKTSNIPIHIDTPLGPHERGIQLPQGFHAQTLEDFSNWKVPVVLAEPEMPDQIRMYPKALVYAEPTKETSIEEIRARRYKAKKEGKQEADPACMETDLLYRSNSSMDVADSASYTSQSNSFPPQVIHQQNSQFNLIASQPTASPLARVKPYAAQVKAETNPHQHPQNMPLQSHQHASSQYSIPFNSNVVNRPMHPQNVYSQANQSQPQPHVSMQPPQVHSMSSSHHHPHSSHSQLQPPQAQPHYVVNNSPMHHSQTTNRSLIHNSQRHMSPYRQNMPYEQHAMPLAQQPQMSPHQNMHQHSSLTMSPHQHNPNHQHSQYASQMHQQVSSPHPMQSPHNTYQHITQVPYSVVETTSYEPKTYANLTMPSPQMQQTYHHPDGMRTIADNTTQVADPNTTAMIDPLSIWGNEESPMAVRQPQMHFSAYADSPNDFATHHVEPKGNAMRTPLKILSDDELAETGSRGGLDVAAAAQPTDGAKRLFEEEDFAENTEMFNLNAMCVSTPDNKQNENAMAHMNMKSTKKRLFGLTDIMEEPSNIHSSGSNTSSHTDKSVSGMTKPSTMATIAERSNYHFNLSQNMKANAELRLQLGMDCESAPESPIEHKPQHAYSNYHIQEQYRPEPVYDDEPQQHVPYPVLNFQPSDPFTNKVLETFMRHVSFPGRHRRSLIRINGVPKLAVKKDPCSIGNDQYIVDKLLGKGSYGNVYKATRCDTGAVVALKIQKPANKWEFYICKEIQARLADNPLKECMMDVQRAYFSEQASVLVSDVHHCSLLTLINTVKVNLTNGPKHHLSIHFSSEMMKIVQALHQVQIIHADIKPDNFLVMATPDSVRLQLIDFGCSIDMSLMPSGTTFTRKVKTDSFQCCEMKDDRPWNYHTDLFCIAATSHVLLFENYIEMKKTDGRWFITKKIPRYYRDDLWSIFFSSMLNMQEGLADLDHLISLFADALDPKELRTATTYILNSFKNR